MIVLYNKMCVVSRMNFARNAAPLKIPKYCCAQASMLILVKKMRIPADHCMEELHLP